MEKMGGAGLQESPVSVYEGSHHENSQTCVKYVFFTFQNISCF